MPSAPPPTVAPDGEERLLVVVGGDVEHEHVGPADGGREHTGVRLKACAQKEKNMICPEVKYLYHVTTVLFTCADQKPYNVKHVTSNTMTQVAQ